VFPILGSERGLRHRHRLPAQAFDEHSKIKAQGSPGITFVEHRTSLEGLLRVLSGKAIPIEFIEWLGTPGLSDLNRMPGKPTYSAE